MFEKTVHFLRQIDYNISIDKEKPIVTELPLSDKLCPLFNLTKYILSKNGSFVNRFDTIKFFEEGQSY